MTDVKQSNKDLEMYYKVKALSDLEICKLLAEIEGLQACILSETVMVQVTGSDDYNFNPLENSEQLLHLMDKHNVERTWEPYDFVGWSYHVLDGQNPIRITERQDFSGDDKPDLTINKAVALAIILNKADAFKLN